MAPSDQGPLYPIGSSELTALIDDNVGLSRVLSCRTVAKGAFRQEHHIRDLEPFDANPGDMIGLINEQTAPTPSETLLAALGSCLTIGIHANAVARAIPISRLELVISGSLNFGALWGTGNLEVAPIGFEAIDVEAHIQSDAPRSVIRALLDHVLLWSPVANSIHNPISLTASLAEA